VLILIREVVAVIVSICRNRRSVVHSMLIIIFFIVLNLYYIQQPH